MFNKFNWFYCTFAIYLKNHLKSLSSNILSDGTFSSNVDLAPSFFDIAITSGFFEAVWSIGLRISPYQRINTLCLPHRTSLVIYFYGWLCDLAPFFLNDDETIRSIEKSSATPKVLKRRHHTKANKQRNNNRMV